MGIRVVQRAFAPPSPYRYVPGGQGRTCRDRERQNRKTLLFGCKSAPLDIKHETNEQEISRSAEVVSQPDTQVPRLETSLEPSWSPEVQQKLARLQEAQLNTDTAAAPTRTTPAEEQDYHKSPSLQRDNSDIPFIEHLMNGVDEAETPEARQRVIVTKATPEEEHAGDIMGEKEKVSEKKEGSLGGGQTIDQYLCGSKRPSLAAYLAAVPPPKAFAEKFYLLSDGKVCLTASLDKAIYSHGEEVHVSVHIRNNSNKTIKRIKIFIVQHVDVCMFSNGKFKNVVSILNPKEDCPINSGGSLDKTYTLIPTKGTTKNWIALEESYTKSGTSLASTVTSTINPDDRNVFAIYVSYYVKVKLVVSMMGGEVVVEINNDPKDDSKSEHKLSDKEQQGQETQKKLSIKCVPENFDEIVTVHRENVTDSNVKEQETFVVNEPHTEKADHCKHKGFSIQRAWCCLRVRRTS